MLNPEDLTVETFQTGTTDKSIGGTLDCCTGCTSGCGINPTAVYCESKSGGVACPVQDTVAVD